MSMGEGERGGGGGGGMQEQEMPSAGGIMKSHASSLLSLHLATGEREARFREVGTTFDKLAVNYQM